MQRISSFILVAAILAGGAVVSNFSVSDAKTDTKCQMSPDLHMDSVQFKAIDGVLSARTAVPIRMECNGDYTGPVLGVHHSSWQAVPVSGN